MSLISKLFGRGTSTQTSKPETEEYNGFTIEPAPTKEGGGYRIGAKISMVVDGEAKVHQMIRADTIADLDEAKKASVFKAKVMIDQMGKGIF